MSNTTEQAPVTSDQALKWQHDRASRTWNAVDGPLQPKVVHTNSHNVKIIPMMDHIKLLQKKFHVVGARDIAQNDTVYPWYTIIWLSRLAIISVLCNSVVFTWI
jgi:hypothetical protein